MPPRRNRKGQYEIQFSQGGRRIHRVLPKKVTHKQAVEAETKLRRKVFDADELGRVPDYTIGEGIMRYLNEYQGKAKRQTENHAKALAEFVSGRHMAEISDVVLAVRNLRQENSNSTRNRRLAILRRVAALAYGRWGWLEKPVKIEMLPEPSPRTKRLSRDDLAALVRKIPKREHRRGVLMAAFTGMRRSELLGLEPDDVRGDVICLADTKTGSPRNVPIIPSIRWAFQRLPLGLDPTGLSKSVQRASGGTVRFHDLRRTTASLLLNAGVPLFTVGEILGHKSVQTTKGYAYLEVKTLKAAMSKLEPARKLPATPQEQKPKTGTNDS